MTPELYRRAKEVFQQVEDSPEPARPALMERLCGGDADLRREVEALLASSAAGRGFLERTPLPEADEPVETAPPERVGPYRIVREIGRGGMGSVYLAERADEAYAGRVAVKLVRRGMDTEDIVRRFRTERQILASLHHPAIARLLDGGTTEDGRPYFVMEHIEGRSLVEDARLRARPLPERLELFRAVCGAVQYAHRMLVVHRDLKPSNVMVTEDGSVRLLDFGLAKVLEATAEGSDARTAAATVIFTPEYASPEQLAGRPLTTATDVYSLGVVLYELVADVHPYRDAAGSPGLLWKAVCENDPPPPSAAAARGGGATAVRLSASLRGDLDAIVLKAMRKEPERRYATVDQLSEDLRRYLSGLPVEARTEGARYRLGKFVRRHRGGVAAAAVAFVSLAAGLGIALQQARALRAQKAVAEKRFGDVRSLANTLLVELNESLVPVPGTTKAREVLVRRGLEYLQRLDAKSGPEDPALQRDVAAAYERLADVQGGANASLGDQAGALESLRKAIAVRERTAGSPRATAQDRMDLARARANLADFLPPKSEEALALITGAVAVAEEAVAQAPGNRLALRRLAIALDSLAVVLLQRGDIEGSLAAREREAALFDRLAADPAATDNDRRNQALVSRYLAGLYQRIGRLPDAERANRRAVAIDEARLARDSGNAETKVDASHSLRSLAGFLRHNGSLPEALSAAERAAALSAEVAARDRANAGAQLAEVRSRLLAAQILTDLGRAGEARAIVERGLSRLEELGAAGVSPRSVEESLALHRLSLGDVYYAESLAARGEVRAAARRAARAEWERARDAYAQMEARGPLDPMNANFRDLTVKHLADLTAGR